MKNNSKKINGMDMAGCCKVEAVVSVDERGQTVLPKELRDKHNIKAGDKLAVASIDCCGGSGCMVLLKVDQLSTMLKEMLGPALNELKK